MSSPLYLNPADYKLAVSLMPIVAIDLIVRDEAGRVLMGLRNNAPAAGSWFVPGGRIRKGETLAAAFGRLVDQELGLAGTAVAHARLQGAYDQFFDSDFTGDTAANSHFVVLAYALPGAWLPALRLPVDDQHQAWRWIPEVDLLADASVHPCSKVYFQQVR